jgi:hypothetical protein
MSANLYVSTQEFDHDLAWIRKNRKALHLATSKAYEDVGRGVMVVNAATQSIPDGAYPFRYISQRQVKKTLGDDAKSVVKEYDPATEYVLVLLKPEKRAVAYTLFRKRRLDSGKPRRSN